jgi:hypothetical protein
MAAFSSHLPAHIRMIRFRAGRPPAPPRSSSLQARTEMIEAVTMRELSLHGPVYLGSGRPSRPDVPRTCRCVVVCPYGE